MFELEVRGLGKINRAIKKSPKVVFEELSKGIKTSVNLIRPIMRMEAPVGKTRKLNENIQSYAVGLEGRVGPNLDITPYAWYVHQGTNPYTIRPKAKKALWWPGLKHPIKKVRHPGIKANPFVERAFGRIKEPVEQILSNSVDNIIRRFHAL